MAIDHEVLLAKYIDHVGYSEGVTFLGAWRDHTVKFTDEEWAELRRLERKEPRPT